MKSYICIEAKVFLKKGVVYPECFNSMMDEQIFVHGWIVYPVQNGIKALYGTCIIGKVILSTMSGNSTIHCPVMNTVYGVKRLNPQKLSLFHMRRQLSPSQYPTLEQGEKNEEKVEAETRTQK